MAKHHNGENAKGRGDAPGTTACAMNGAALAVTPFSFAEQFGSVAALGGGAGGGFFIVKWFVEMIAGRLDKREARLDAGADKLIGALEKRIETLTQRLDAVEHLLADCQRLHSKSEAEVMRLTAIVEAQGEIRQRAQQVVAADRMDQKAKGDPKL